MSINWNKTKDKRPEHDNQLIVYYFEPFGQIFTGRYEKETDTVGGHYGFTTMFDEVPCWIDHDELVKSIPENLKQWD